MKRKSNMYQSMISFNEVKDVYKKLGVVLRIKRKLLTLV